MKINTDTLHRVIVGKNEAVSVGVVRENGASIKIQPPTHKQVGLQNCIVEPVRGGGDYEEYTGTYSVTPSKQKQVLSTQNKVLANNITVNPIPQNYGLISWNGSTLTIS